MTSYAITWKSLGTGKLITGQTRYATRAEADTAATFMDMHFAMFQIKHTVILVDDGPDASATEAVNEPGQGSSPLGISAARAGVRGTS